MIWPQRVLIPCSMVCPGGRLTDSVWATLAGLSELLRGARLLVLYGGMHYDDELDSCAVQQLNEVFARGLPRPGPRLVCNAANGMWRAPGHVLVVSTGAMPTMPQAHTFHVARPARISERVMREAMVEFALAQLSPFPCLLRLRRERVAPEHDDREDQQRVREGEAKPPRRVHPPQQPV
jgi:hypothetical protein